MLCLSSEIANPAGLVGLYLKSRSVARDTYNNECLRVRPEVFRCHRDPSPRKKTRDSGFQKKALLDLAKRLSEKRNYLKHFARVLAIATSFCRSAGIKSGPASSGVAPLRENWITPTAVSSAMTGHDISF